MGGKGKGGGGSFPDTMAPRGNLQPWKPVDHRRGRTEENHRSPRGMGGEGNASYWSGSF